MPERPEVEVLRRTLAPRLEGRRILGLAVHRPDLREPIPQAGLERSVGQVFENPSRRGKYLLLPTDSGPTIAVHLGMSGRLTLVPAAEPRAPHEHLAWRLDGEERLRFVDPRRFGLVLALARDGWESDPHFASLGLEPLGEDWSGAALRERAGGRRAPAKSFLMDAGVVVGVGNIYASEALYEAGIHPARGVDRISDARWDRLAEAVRAVLGNAISHGGTTFRDYVDAEGRQGGNLHRLRVYGREAEPCERCGRTILRRVQSGRSTFYCPGCQR